jgi:hypothetical protein
MTSVSTKRQEGALEPGSAIYLAGDLGKSACKFLYWSSDICKFHPLWLSSDVVEGVSDSSLRQFEASGSLTNSMWLSVNGKNILVGESATGFGTSFSDDKVNVAAYQVIAALGLIAVEMQLSDYDATVSLTVPLNEFRLRAQVASRLREIGEEFNFCGCWQRAKISANFYPEGTGLYLLHKKEIELQTQAPYLGRTIVLMMGHRNLSVLVFEGGKLNATLSQTSDSLGFWSGFRSDASAVGVRELDFPPLLNGLTSGNPEQLSRSQARMKDFSSEVDAIKQGYTTRFESFCRDRIVPLLDQDESCHVLLGGGVAYILRPELTSYFSSLNVLNLTFADCTNDSLLPLIRQTYRATTDPARSMRFADVYGVAQTLSGRMVAGG